MEKNNELAVVKTKNSLIVELIIKIKNWLSKNETNDINEEELLSLQNSYEKNEIKVEQFTIKQYEGLIELYKKQINQIEDEISDKEKNINIITI